MNVRMTEIIKNSQMHSLEIASVKSEKADRSDLNLLKSENEKLKLENAAIKTRLDRIERALLSK
jgi:hypothetical protein